MAARCRARRPDGERHPAASWARRRWVARGAACAAVPAQAAPRSALPSICLLHGLLLACTFSVTAHAVSLPREVCPWAPGRQPLRCAFAGAGLEHAAPPAAARRAAARRASCVRMAAGRRGAERAALELAFAEQVERKYMVQKSIRQLQAKRDEEVEKEQWARILSKVNEDVDSDLDEEPGPWELTPDMLEEVDEVLEGMVASDYLRVALGANATGGGVDVLGRLGEIDEGTVQSAFDAAIREQEEKRPKGLLERLGLDARRGSSSSDDIFWGSGRQKPPAPASASSKKTFEEHRYEIETQIEQDYAFLELRSARLADRAHAQGRGRFPVKGHKVPWELIEREVLAPPTPPLSLAACRLRQSTHQKHVQIPSLRARTLSL